MPISKCSPTYQKSVFFFLITLQGFTYIFFKSVWEGGEGQEFRNEVSSKGNIKDGARG